MATTFKNQLREVMQMAWQFVKANGYSMSEALKCAWANIKLKAKMQKQICEFYFKKVDGSMRQAFGHLIANKLPTTKGSDKKKSELVQVYFDCEKQEYRCFKKCNLIKIV